MHLEIVKFSSQEFYDNKIENVVTLKEKINEEFNIKFNWPKKRCSINFSSYKRRRKNHEIWKIKKE